MLFALRDIKIAAREGCRVAQKIACLASVPVPAARNIGPREGVFAFGTRGKWGENKRSARRGKEGNAFPSFPSPSPLLPFLLSPHFPRFFLSPHFPRVLFGPSHGPIFSSARTGKRTLATQASQKMSYCFSFC